LSRQGSTWGFDAVEIRLRPSPPLSGKVKHLLTGQFNHFDFWFVEKGTSLEHAHVPEHVAFRTSDKILVGLFNSGHINLDAGDLSTKKIKRVESLIFRLVDLMGRATKQKIAYQVSVLFHLTTKDKGLQRFMQNSLVAASNPYLRRRLGDRIEIQSLLIGLDQNSSIGIFGRDHFDYMSWLSIKIRPRPKGFLCRAFSDASAKQKELARS
jgi:hypothetical protein